ncbi:MAG: hypothetical protein J6K00_03645 [Oscillospiraceae bacterium]|nr:hypothetical protein [Oscillospiraceae bacterium]
MKERKKYFYLDGFEDRMLVGCLMTARNEYLREGKSTEDVNNPNLKIIDASSKKLRVIVRENAQWTSTFLMRETGCGTNCRATIICRA